MGICDEATQNPALQELLVGMGTELHSHSEHDMSITQMHGVHTDKQRAMKCSSLREWMRSDE
eukprot:15401973-Heterocapsa_arctica.AAC.1